MQKKKLIYKNGRYYINDEKEIVGISAQTYAVYFSYILFSLYLYTQ